MSLCARTDEPGGRIPAVRGFVANTDFDWFTFLAARQPLEEVNFWQPSGGDAFRALDPGEPFFFRLKEPHYAIAGSASSRATRS